MKHDTAFLEKKKKENSLVDTALNYIRVTSYSGPQKEI